MKNALLPPVSSQLYSIGNNEVQMPNLDVFMQMETKGNVGGGGFSLESNPFYNDNQQLRDGLPFACPHYHSFLNYQQGLECQSGSSSSFDDIYQPSVWLSSKPAATPHQFELNMQNARKRPVEFSELLPLNGFSDLVDSKISLNDRKKNKRKKFSSFEKQGTTQVMEALKEIKEQRAPVRRSQKLSDKITTLQKLVSPYGKTDTASVLQEASFYINLLQEQIQNLFQMLSSSYNTATALHPEETGRKQADLRSRGLCLVPVSFTQKMTSKEDLFTPAHDAITRKMVTPRNI